MKENVPFTELDAILATKASAECFIVLENFGVSNVEQEQLESNCVIVI